MNPKQKIVFKKYFIRIDCIFLMKIFGVRKIIFVEEILFKDLFYIFSNKLNKCFKNTLRKSYSLFIPRQ